MITSRRIELMGKIPARICVTCTLNWGRSIHPCRLVAHLLIREADLREHDALVRSTGSWRMRCRILRRQIWAPVLFPIHPDLANVDAEVLADAFELQREALEALIQRHPHRCDEAVLMYLELAVEVIGDVTLEELEEHLVLASHPVHGRSPLSLIVPREVVVDRKI
jgi:hypothetical protein